MHSDDRLVQSSCRAANFKLTPGQLACSFSNSQPLFLAPPPSPSMYCHGLRKFGSGPGGWGQDWNCTAMVTANLVQVLLTPTPTPNYVWPWFKASFLGRALNPLNQTLSLHFCDADRPMIILLGHAKATKIHGNFMGSD